MARFSDEEIRRYARQMVLPEVGGIGQERLRAGRAQATSELEALANCERREGVEIWAKAEFMNPGGSVKDRAAFQMVKDGIAQGLLTPDKILIDSTSGNTGVAYSLVGAALGIRIALVMPQNV